MDSLASPASSDASATGYGYIWPVVWTDRPWWTVEDAAQLLRINRETLYDACASGDFPHQKLGRYLRIPAEALRLRVRPETRSRTYHVSDDAAQLELPLDVSCLIPVRRFRNTRELVDPFHYEAALYGGRVPRTPLRSPYSQSDDLTIVS